jgi:hypothetical protein
VPALRTACCGDREVDRVENRDPRAAAPDGKMAKRIDRRGAIRERPLACKVFRWRWIGGLQSCVRPHMRASLSTVVDNEQQAIASKAELSSRRLSCKPHIRRDDNPTTVPYAGRRAPGGRHHSVKTAAKHHAEQRRRPLGPLSPRRLGSPGPACRTDQDVGFMAAPSGNTPWVANRHSAISSFRARATTITFRMRAPVAPARSRYQRTQTESGW